MPLGRNNTKEVSFLVIEIGAIDRAQSHGHYRCLSRNDHASLFGHVFYLLKLIILNIEDHQIRNVISFPDFELVEQQSLNEE